MTTMIRVHIEGRFANPGYIAEPYWPARERLINIIKESGMSRARSSANKRKALEEHLRQIGMTLSEYEQLRSDAEKPFHTDSAGTIIIPAEKVAAFGVNVQYQSRSANRLCDPDQVRSRIWFSDWTTDRTASDGYWERFVLVTSGTGAKLSNQRGLRRSAYISPCNFSGSFLIDPVQVDPATFRNNLIHGGRFVGIGAARKMGWGRFGLTLWREEVVEENLGGDLVLETVDLREILAAA